MTTYTRDQIDRARQRADAAADEADANGELHADAWIDMLAEELALDMAPERPEPGTWHIVKDGPHAGKVARVTGGGGLNVAVAGGDWAYFTAGRSDWPALEPACVISEATFQRLVNLRADEDANPGDAQYAPAKPPVLTKKEVGGLHDSTPESVGHGWSDWSEPSQDSFVATVNAALAKHGGARELPTWGEMRDAVASCKGNGWGLTADPINAITDAVCALLGGGDRGE